jgi:hypothetical protein
MALTSPSIPMKKVVGQQLEAFGNGNIFDECSIKVN